MRNNLINRVVGRFFMVGGGRGLIKNIRRHGWPTTKNLDQNVKDSKSHIFNSSFDNIILGIQLVLFVQTLQQTSSGLLFLISVFLAKSLKANKNQQKISLILQYNFSFKTSLILSISTHLTLKIIGSQNTAKSLSLYRLSSKYFPVWYQKKHLHYTIS